MVSVEECYEPLPLPAPSSACAGLVREAERELAAFLLAVKEVHGPHRVNIAAEHWMQALNGICLSRLTSRESFRMVTLSATSTLCH